MASNEFLVLSQLGGRRLKYLLLLACSTRRGRSALRRVRDEVLTGSTSELIIRFHSRRETQELQSGERAPSNSSCRKNVNPL